MTTLLGRAVSAAGAILVVLALSFTLILCGAALFQDGPVAFVFVLIFGSVPIALGVGMAHLGTRGYWSRSIDVRGLWRMPGAAGVAIALVSLPLIFLLPDVSILIAFVALCLYPILDVPRILARPSWWRGAIVSALVWLAVFAGLGAAVESVRHPGDDSMIFLVPFMMYPLVLGISGLVRLEGRVRGRPSASSVRMAAILGVAACALLVGVPITMSIIPVVLEKITGYSPPNTVYSENGDVLTAAPGQVSVRLTGGDTKSFRLGPETKFDFRGPGSPLVKGPAAGPAWLTAGQRVGLEYVIRHREAQAQYVTIWIERKGCKDDANWAAAVSRTGPAPPPGTPGLAGTTWDGEIGSPDAPGGPARTTFEFLAGNGLAWR
ncbi:MAG TPA: hypothetical protein VFS78_06270, partial [Vicinamibacteria bacterium]|nr:hypothetical protein [Vicinamibacteria bacterium]